MKISNLSYIFLLALVLRVIGLNQSLWLDEATSASVAKNLSFTQILRDFTPSDFHPPLYYFLLKAVTSILGTSELAVRSLSLIADLGIIATLYVFGRRLLNRTVGTLAALLWATAPLAIYYSGEARMYTLATLFVSLASFAFISTLKKPQLKWWCLFTLASTAAYFTLYTTIFMIPVFIVGALLVKPKPIWWRRFLLSNLITALSFALYSPILIQQITSGSINAGSTWGELLGRVSLKNIILIPVKFLIGRISFENKIIYALFVFLGAVIYGLALKRAKTNKFLYVWLTIPLLLGVVVSFVLPMLSYFRFLFILPCFYLLSAVGLYKTKERYFLPLMSGMLILNFISVGRYLSSENFHREDWRGVVSTIQNEVKGATYKVAFPANSQMEGIKYYWSDVNVAGGREGVDRNSDQIWYIPYVVEVVDPSKSTQSQIESLGYIKEREYSFNGINVLKYIRIKEQQL